MASLPNKDSTVFVTMLGDFSITIGSETVYDTDVQAKKPWMILEYLIAFRDRAIPNNELISMIWSGDKSKNPTGALKTLVFRSRQLITKLNMKPQHLVLQRNGAYEWNPNIETTVDVDLFENLTNRIFDTKHAPLTDAKMLEYCLKALDMYKGNFLSNSSEDAWVIPISAYYHSLFQQILYRTLEILNQQENYEKIIELCERFVLVDPYDEEIHYNLIYSLFQNGNQKKAISHYTQTTDMFYKKFQRTPSERFKDLYKTIQDIESGMILDLSIVRDRLQEESVGLGAYCCEYSVFKDIFQLECRSIERTGDTIFLCMFSLTDSYGELLQTPVLSKAMEALGSAIRSSLRRGDVYTRFSVSQYLILLPSGLSSNAQMVLKRIKSKFQKLYYKKNMIIHSSLMSLNGNNEDVSQETLTRNAMTALNEADEKSLNSAGNDEA